MSLISLGFAVCELHKLLIYKNLWRTGKTPKAVLAAAPYGGPADGAPPLGRVSNDLLGLTR